MNTEIKTWLAGMFLLAVSCKKDYNMIQTTRGADQQPTANVIPEINAPGKYASVVIGTQKWMVKNLAVSHYRNGDYIPQVKDPRKWAALTTGAWCWYNNDSAMGAVYGKLYNWYAVNDPRGLAPIGWHVPSDAEWDTLATYIGGYQKGGKLKDTGTIEAGTGLWHAPNKNANNKTGFTGLPGGVRFFDGKSFVNLGSSGDWWSSTQFDGDNAWYSRLFFLYGSLVQGYYSKQWGNSVRCLKD